MSEFKYHWKCKTINCRNSSKITKGNSNMIKFKFINNKIIVVLSCKTVI